MKCPVCSLDLSSYTQWPNKDWDSHKQVDDSTTEHSVDTECNRCNSKLKLIKTVVETYTVKVTKINTTELTEALAEIQEETRIISDTLNKVKQYIRKPYEE